MEDIESKLKNMNRKNEFFPKFASVFSMVSMVFALIGAVSVVIIQGKNIFNIYPNRENSIIPVVAEYDRSIVELRQQLRLVTERLEGVFAKPGSGDGDSGAARIAELEASIADLGRKMSVIETAVMENPERAMSIPMLRRDLDSIKANSTQAILSSRAEIDRIYDLNKWFIGLMITTMISVFSLAVGSILKNK